MIWLYLSPPDLAAKLSQLVGMCPPLMAISPTDTSRPAPATRNSSFCSRQYACPPVTSITPKPTVMIVPSPITHHWVWMPSRSCLASSELLRLPQNAAPVAAPIEDKATGTANVNANQALKPIQKKIIQSPWLHDSRKPTIGCSTRLTKT